MVTEVNSLRDKNEEDASSIRVYKKLYQEKYSEVSDLIKNHAKEIKTLN